MIRVGSSRRHLGLTLLLCLLFVAPGHSRRRDGGSTAAEMLRLGEGARGPAMGEAYTSYVEGPDALRYNPAGFGWTDRQSISLTYNKIFLSSNFGSVNWARPLSRDRGLALGMKWIDYGRIRRTTVADQTGSGSAFYGANDLAVSFGYGMRLADEWSIGVIGRYFSSKIDTFDASTLTGDIGLQWRGARKWTAGIALQNIGAPLQFRAVEEDMPFLARVGFSYELIQDRWTAAVDVEKTEEEEATFHLGTEYRYTDMLALRAGFDGRNRAGPGLTMGFGFTKDRAVIDYSFSPFGDLGGAHRASLTYDVGPLPEKTRPEAAKTAVKIPPATTPPSPATPAAPGALPGKIEFARTALPDTPPDQSQDMESVERMMITAREYYDRKEYGKAILFYRSALSLDPRNFRARYNIAAIHYRRNEYKEAAVEFENALSLQPRDVNANLFLALCRQNLGENRQAIAGFEKVLQLSPGHAVASQRLVQLQRAAPAPE